MSFTPAGKFCVYDSWLHRSFWQLNIARPLVHFSLITDDLTRPKVSPRSRLYHPKPIGVGTTLSESCTGPLSNKSRPGYCCRCEKWLAHSELRAPEAVSPDELNYKLWVANQMGELIAAVPTMTSDPT